jgi:thymidine kinase
METELILGPMFAGKTTELINRLKKYLVKGQTVLLYTHSADIRYTRESLASSHDGSKMRAIRISSLAEVQQIPDDVSVIGIDEGQFFPGLGEFCQSQNKMGRTVIVAALNHEATPGRDVWANVVPLMGFAFITMVTNFCIICNAPGLCSRRINKDAPVTAGSIDIGENDKYIPTCSKCYTLEPIPDNVIQKRQKAVDYILKISK